MPQETLTEKRVIEIVQEILSSRIEDVDEIRKSPAGRVLIIEAEVKNINEKIDRLDNRIAEVKNDLKNEIQSSRNLTLALFVALLGLVGSIVIKIFFFM